MYGEIGEVWAGMGRYGEIWGDWGGMGRYREIASEMLRPSP